MKIMDAVFQEWLAEGIIERVPAGQVDDWGRYLPHRHVVKEDSITAIRPVFDASAKEKDHHQLKTASKRGQISSSSLQQTCYTSEKCKVSCNIKTSFPTWCWFRTYWTNQLLRKKSSSVFQPKSNSKLCENLHWETYWRLYCNFCPDHIIQSGHEWVAE